MKKIILLLVASTLVLFSYGNRASVSWTGSVSGEWNVGGNWTGGSVPGPADDAIIMSASGYEPIVNGTVPMVSSLTLGTGRTLTINGSLTVSGSFTHTGIITINASGTFTANGSVTANAGNSVTVNGLLRLSGTSGDFSGSATVNGTGNVEVSAGRTVVINGSLVINTSFHHSGIVNITSSHNLQVNGEIDVSGGGTLSVASSGQITFGGSAGDWDGNGSITGAGSVSVSAGRTLVIDGNLTVSSSFTHTGIITVNSSRTLTVDASFSASGNASFNGAGSIVINTSKTLTIDGTVTMAGTLNVSGSGHLQVSATRKLTVSGDVNVDSFFDVFAEISVDAGKSISIGGTCTVSGSATFSGSGSVVIKTGRTISVDGSLTASGGISVSGDGSLVVNASGSFNVDGTVTVSSTFVHNGVITVYGSRTVVFSGSFTANAGSSIVVSAGGSGGIFSADASLAVNAGCTITVNSGGIFRFGGTSGTVSGNATVSGSGTLEVSASRTLTVSGAMTVNTAFNHSGVIDVSGSGSMTVNGALVVKQGAHLNVHGSGSLTATGSATFSADSFFDVFFEVSVAGSASFSGNVDAQSGSTIDVHGDLTANGSLAFHGNVTFYASSHVTVTGSGSVSFTGTARFKADATGQASLVCGAGVSCSGTVTVEIYLTKNTWHYYSVPVSGAKAGIFTNDYVRTYIEPSGTWGPWLNTNDPLGGTCGYSVWKPTASPGEEESTGPLNNGTMPPLPLTRTFIATKNDCDGWNLIGNPFLSHADLQSQAGWEWVNVDHTCFYWDGNWVDPEDPDNIGRYASWTWGSYPVGTNGGSRYIPPEQGFFVHCNGNPPGTGGYYGIGNEVRVHNSQAYWKDSRATPGNELRLNACYQNSGMDELVVRFVPGSTPGFDGDFDAYKLTGNQSLQLYARTPDEKSLSVTSLPVVGENTIVPVSVMVRKSGAYSLSASQLSTFTPGSEILLEDLKTGTVQDLVMDSVYAFTADSAENPDRFVLLFSDVYYTGTQAPPQSSLIRVYSYENTVFIRPDCPGTGTSRVFICDMLGRKMMDCEIGNQPVSRVKTDLPAGYYVVRVMGKEGTVTRKVYLD